MFFSEDTREWLGDTSLCWYWRVILYCWKGRMVWNSQNRGNLKKRKYENIVFCVKLLIGKTLHTWLWYWVISNGNKGTCYCYTCLLIFICLFMSMILGHSLFLLDLSDSTPSLYWRLKFDKKYSTSACKNLTFLVFLFAKLNLLSLVKSKSAKLMFVFIDFLNLMLWQGGRIFITMMTITQCLITPIILTLL